VSVRTYHAGDPDRVTPDGSVECPACGAESACVYRCDNPECGADLVGESEGSAGRIGGSR
jgi:hypothetical protein